MRATIFLSLRFNRPLPSSDDTAAFAAYINNRMDFRSYQAEIEAATSTILYTEDQYRARSRGEAIDLDTVPLPSTDLVSEEG
jgi:hypothetical protein